MNFLTAYHTDAGIRKSTNQDALLIEQAEAGNGNLLLAAVCDGMGGLSRGEVASGSMIKRLSDWFGTKFPLLLEDGLSPGTLRESLEELVFEANLKISRYGYEHGIALGTTCAAFLAAEDRYFILNVGDSRIYLLSDMLYQLTKDQSYVEREIENGRMTPEEAAADPRRSVLLQCIGAGGRVEPDFFMGKLEPDSCFLICSDGFVHTLSPAEIFNSLNSGACAGSDVMRERLYALTEVCKSRQEKDNITALLIKTV